MLCLIREEAFNRIVAKTTGVLILYELISFLHLVMLVLLSSFNVIHVKGLYTMMGSNSKQISFIHNFLIYRTLFLLFLIV